ncbi:MAG: hypothetical protein ABEI58_02705 [Candidatus Nanohaloarchaea archaeon]
MERAEKVKEKARELIESGRKPSALGVAQELEYTEDDVHRCLNSLERQGEVETYTRDVFGRKHRMIGVKR